MRAVVGGGLAVVGESGQRRAEAGGDGRGEMGEVKRVGSGVEGGGASSVSVCVLPYRPRHV